MKLKKLIIAVLFAASLSSVSANNDTNSFVLTKASVSNSTIFENITVTSIHNAGSSCVQNCIDAETACYEGPPHPLWGYDRCTVVREVCIFSHCSGNSGGGGAF